MIEENTPDKEEPEDKKFWCEEHKCYMFKDLGGNIVCIACLIESRLYTTDRYEILLEDEYKTVVYDREKNETEIRFESGVIERVPGKAI